MAQQVPPKSRPFNFTKPLAGENGQMHDEWQQAFTSIQQRLDGPISTAAGAIPTASTDPGLPGAAIVDGVDTLYVNFGPPTGWIKFTGTTF